MAASGNQPANKDDIASLAREAAALLRFQRSLGLLDIPQASGLAFKAAPSAEGAPQLQQALPSPSAGGQQPSPPAVTDSPLKKNSPSAQTKEGAAAALALIAEDIGPDCRRCGLHEKRTHIVFGVGDPTARLMFVGEAPGRDEDLQGEPFVGAAGQLLDKMILAMGLKRSEVYIANICKCRPPRNRDPLPEEVLACEPFLVRQIQAVQPEIIVALGRYACQTLLRKSTPISKMRGSWQSYEGIPLMPTFHPAYLLRNPSGKKPVWQDLQQVMARLGLTDPRKR